MSRSTAPTLYISRCVLASVSFGFCQAIRYRHASAARVASNGNFQGWIEPANSRLIENHHL